MPLHYKNILKRKKSIMSIMQETLRVSSMGLPLFYWLQKKQSKSKA